MFFLLDINVLIALADPSHQFHSAFNKWYVDRNCPPLATCPITENGFLRIYGHPDYPDGPGSPDMALAPLVAIRNQPNNVFIPDDLSLADNPKRQLLQNATPNQLTDIYLLLLAVRHHGTFLTFDRGIPSNRVTGGTRALELLC